jgi:hypothetical protein
VRLLKKKSVQVDVVRVDRYGQRTTALKEANSAMPGMTVVQVHTPEAILDWVLHPDIAAWAAAAVTPETT